jgi:2'-5' RNA ligase
VPALRLFIALSLPGPVVDRVVDWQRRALAGANVRVMPADHLHVTLVFLGNRPAGEVDALCAIVAENVRTSRRPAFHAARYHETARVGMIQLREDALPGDHFAGRANMLTGHLMRDLEARGVYTREHRSWRPHVTVARFASPPRLRLEPPDLGTFAPDQVVLYRSTPTPTGSQYEPLAEFAWPG